MVLGPIHWHSELQHQAWVPQQHRGLHVCLYILLPGFSAPLHALQHVFHAATQQSHINALRHPIRENAENVAVHCQRQHLRNSCLSYISEIWYRAPNLTAGPVCTSLLLPPSPTAKKHVQPPGTSAHVVGSNPSSEHTVWSPVTAAEKQRLEVLHLVLLSFVWHIKHRTLITVYCST